MADTYDIRKTQVAIPLVHGASVTTVTSAAMQLNGMLEMQKVKSGAVDGSATLTLNIIDADGDTVYSKASLASNTTDVTDMTGDQQVPLSGSYTVQIITSASQTATNNTFTVTLYIAAD